jgi:hypothetical protein
LPAAGKESRKMEEIEYKGLVIKIEQEEFLRNPREEWDNFAHMVCWHRRYDLGDKHNMDLETAKELINNNPDVFSLPLYLYDHSGITMRTGPFSCPWDSGRVGWIYCDKDMIRKEWKVKKVTKKLINWAYKCMEGEVKTYDMYLTGDVWRYDIKDKNGDDLDSCGGFFGYNYCLEEAKSAADWHVKDIKGKRRAEVLEMVQRVIRNIKTAFVWDNVLTA